MRRNYIVLTLIALVAVVAGCTDSVEPDQDLGSMETPESDATQGDETSDSENSNESDMTQESNSTETSSDLGNESNIREIVIEGRNYNFNNDTINVDQGETVRIVLENVGGFHDLRIPSKEVGTDQIEGGQTDSFTVTFEETGSYEFICSVGNHAARGMIGNIEVS